MEKRCPKPFSLATRTVARVLGRKRPAENLIRRHRKVLIAAEALNGLAGNFSRESIDVYLLLRLTECTFDSYNEISSPCIMPM